MVRYRVPYFSTFAGLYTVYITLYSSLQYVVYAEVESTQSDEEGNTAQQPLQSSNQPTLKARCWVYLQAITCLNGVCHRSGNDLDDVVEVTTHGPFGMSVGIKKGVPSKCPVRETLMTVSTIATVCADLTPDLVLKQFRRNKQDVDTVRTAYAASGLCGFSP